MAARPMLGDVELQLVQEIQIDGDEVRAEHGVPALEGDFLQRLGRRASRIELQGVLVGPDVRKDLDTLRRKFRAAEPVSFVADIASATQVDKVLIEELGVREVAGAPERFEYAFTLREYITPPKQKDEPPPPPPPPPPPSTQTGTLVVEVIVQGQPSFDFSQTSVNVDGTGTDGTHVTRTLTHHERGVWTEEEFPPADITATATVTTPESMTGSAQGTVQAGQTTRLTITLQPGAVIAHAFVVTFWFDKAFVEPCMLEVLRSVAAYATSHADEKLLIAGHTDLAGSADYNQYLSERRARAVYAVLTHDQNPAGAVAEWNALRKAATGQPGLEDTWSVREYQYMLQALGFYTGNVDGLTGPQTAAAIGAFRNAKGLPAGNTVDDAVWAALITDYLATAQAAVPQGQFLPNCAGEILKWLGCGEQAPIKNTQDAWRPNRRVELLFAVAQKLPCQEPQPKTWTLLPTAAGGTQWCLGPGDENDRYCFTTRDAQQQDKWLVQPAEPGTVTVSGSIKHADGSPAANTKYVLIAPDGEDMAGEVPAGDNHGRPIPGVTGADGSFSYPGKQKGVGTYVLQVQAPVLAWAADQPEASAKGNEVCRRLSGSATLDVMIR